MVRIEAPDSALEDAIGDLTDEYITCVSLDVNSISVNSMLLKYD